MKWIRKDELDYDNLHNGRVFVAMKEKDSLKIRQTKIWHYRFEDCAVPGYLMQSVENGTYLLIDNPDGSRSVWCFSCCHFKNIEAMIYEEDMVSEVNEIIENG